MQTRERERTALELRRRGYSYERIGEALGVSISTAHERVNAALAKAADELKEEAAAHIALDLDRLDSMLDALWDRAEGGDEQAIDRIIKIQERRAKLLGLDAPHKTELTGKEGGPVAVSDARTALGEAFARVTAKPDGGAAGGGAGEPS